MVNRFHFSMLVSQLNLLLIPFRFPLRWQILWGLQWQRLYVIQDIIFYGSVAWATCACYEFIIYQFDLKLSDERNGSNIVLFNILFSYFRPISFFHLIVVIVVIILVIILQLVFVILYSLACIQMKLIRYEPH